MINLVKKDQIMEEVKQARSEGKTYVVSIVNNLAVFAQF